MPDFNNSEINQQKRKVQQKLRASLGKLVFEVFRTDSSADLGPVEDRLLFASWLEQLARKEDIKLRAVDRSQLEKYFDQVSKDLSAIESKEANATSNNAEEAEAKQQENGKVLPSENRDSEQSIDSQEPTSSHPESHSPETVENQPRQQSGDRQN